MAPSSARISLVAGVLFGLCFDANQGGVPATPNDSELDWAACFHNGRAAAEKVAAESGMRVVGEIIPDSNCYQLTHVYSKSLSGRRKREAVDEARRVIEASGEIDWAEAQVIMSRCLIS